MANYKYDARAEVFKRTDNRGNPLKVNITEAQRIESLINLGYSTTAILNKVNLNQGTASTVKNFIRNYNEGNIEIPTDAPAPVKVLDEITDSKRIDELEKRVTELELIQKESALDKVKKWIRS